MNEITSYGDSSLQKIYIRFKNIGQDVGHYDSLVLRTDDHANLQASSQTANQSRENNLTTPPARSLKNLLKEPTILKRKRGGRCSTATVLTSSPARTNLQAKEDKKAMKKRPTKKRETLKVSKKTSQEILYDGESDIKEKDWPCIYCYELSNHSRPGDV